MRVVVQRVSNASVTVEGEKIASIGNGLLVLAGFEQPDGVEDLDWMSGKITQLRIFNDAQGVMNLSVKETNGEILLVSQFTLHAATKKAIRLSRYIDPQKIATGPLLRPNLHLKASRSMSEILA